ncbi:hypothetical protein HPB48_011583 [Haemaphysalis longicornis]|uniref:Endonuclease/exonuclease/phosphatase domain-containing protein n=1 Tax=Haemaphysalis longicornis TaxID=44386 RepID=A0A9J6GSK3_HAELO|nr:hypothetical protein HPB48_011583 [Haemaphysalis longicornis]
MGDFNAVDHLWSYKYANPRGSLVFRLIEDTDLNLIIDPTKSARLGTSSKKGSNPDLTIIKKIPYPTWTNLGRYNGSNHALLATTLYVLEYKISTVFARLTD